MNSHSKEPYYGYHKPESLIDIEKMLKFRLPTWKDEKYWKWCSSQRIGGYEWHHLLGRKYCDFLLVNIPKVEHDRIHHGIGYVDGEFETLFIEALNNLMRYIKCLQSK